MNAFGTLSIGLVLSLSGSAFAAPTQPGQDISDQNQNQTEKVFGCWGDEDGHLEGGVFFLPMDQDARQIIDAMNQVNRGAVDNRVDFVIVGDGYTANEQALFHTNATTIENSFFQFEPFKSYEPYFRFTQVEVVSPESGVDGDPSQGVSRNTALDMSYWCAGIERLLCVNVSKAYTAAAAAPDIDQVIAIANSSKYGGAGYPDNNLGTAAGRNGAAAQIAIHEMGHSLGDLADEYTYGGPNTYTGPELTPVDVSIYNRTVQLADSRKWWRWMDASLTGFDNPVSTYQGGNYSVNGVYRPSSNSMMRNLGRPFNLVSAEQLLRKIYREVNPIDDGTPSGTVVSQSDTLWITPMQPLNHDLQVLWYLDEQIIADAIQQDTLDLSTLAMDSGEHTIRVEVIDTTPWVRNEAIRNAFMSESRVYTVNACTALADLTGDGEVNFFDVSAFLSAFDDQSPIADFTGDGLFDFFDVSAFLVAFSSGGCP
jgi:IgA Peptidase M64